MIFIFLLALLDYKVLEGLKKGKDLFVCLWTLNKLYFIITNIIIEVTEKDLGKVIYLRTTVAGCYTKGQQTFSWGARW